MTEQEAINRIRCRIDTASDIAGKGVDGKPYEDMEMAIQALEKQIPKKPKLIEDKMWTCPVCNNNLLNKWIKYPTELMPKSKGFPRCMSCGQAIDWSD